MDWLREKIEAELVVERDGWAVERVGRVREQLEAFGFDIVVVASSEHAAFTAPGRTIYISRRLLERLDDDATAFVIAHELAHHRLGHVPQLVPRFLPLRTLLALLHARIATPEHERHADLLAVEQCLLSGYDLDLCLNGLEDSTRVEAARSHSWSYYRGERIEATLARDREKAKKRRKVAIASVAGGAAALVLLLLRRR